MEPQTKTFGPTSGFVYVMDYVKPEAQAGVLKVVVGGKDGKPTSVAGYEKRRHPGGDGSSAVYECQPVTDAKDRECIARILRDKGLQEPIEFE